MRRPVATLSLAMLLATTPNANAFNPEGLDILRLRLGMTEAQVKAVLLRQGVSADRIDRQEVSCPDTRPCEVTIVSPAQDGELTIVLTPPAGNSIPTVHQITYVITGHAINQDALLMASVLGRFGRPDEAIPMTWCRTPTIRHTCPEDEAWLRFWPGSQTLVLRAAEPSDDGWRQPP